MAEAYYEPTPATDGATMNPVPGAVFQVFEIADTTFSTPLSLRVGSGNPTTTVTASDTLATLPGVYVTSPNFEHIWKSGTFEWRRDSIDGAKKAIEDAKVAASNSASSAAVSEQAAVDAAALVDAPADQIMRDTAANPATAFGGLLSASFVGAVVITGAGIDPTGTTNSTTAIQAKLDEAAAAKRHAYLPPGTYVASGLTAPNGLVLIGNGNPTLKVPATGGTIITLLDRNNVKIKGITFRGTLAPLTAEGMTGAGGTVEIGIRINKTYASTIEDCMFYDFNYAGVHAALSGNVASGARFDGDSNRIVNCLTENCFFGYEFGSRGEYQTVIGCVVQRCYTGVKVTGGNNLFTGCQINRNTLGFYVASGTNSGHGSATGCAFNHNGVTAIQVDEPINGFLFTGCQIFGGKILFNVCRGVIITGCEISAAIQLKGGGWNTIKDSVALGTTAVTHNLDGVTDATIVNITKTDGTVLT